MPIMPSQSGSDPGKAPNPMSEVVTGVRVCRANSVKASAALDKIKPPPPKSSGRLAFLIRPTTFLSCFMLGL